MDVKSGATSDAMDVDQAQQTMAESSTRQVLLRAVARLTAHRQDTGSSAQEARGAMIVDETEAQEQTAPESVRKASDGDEEESDAQRREALDGTGGGIEWKADEEGSSVHAERKDADAAVDDPFSVGVEIKEDESVERNEMLLVASAQEWMSQLKEEGRTVVLQETFGPADWRGPATQSVSYRHRRRRPLKPYASLVEWREHHDLHGWTPYYWVVPILQSEGWGKEGQMSAPRMVIESNRSLVPEIPPAKPKATLYYDGRYGPGEETWLPQWFRDDQWYIGFVEMMRSSSRATTDAFYFRTHSDASADIAWYRVNWSDFLPVREKIWSLGQQLKQRVREALMHLRFHWWQVHDFRTNHAWSRWKRQALRPNHMAKADAEELNRFDSLSEEAQRRIRERLAEEKKQDEECQELERLMPQDAVEEIDALAVYLCHGSGTSWEIRDALAQFQRCVLHMRGWLHFLNCLGRDPLPSLKTLGDTPVRDMDASLRRYGNRHCRGVFTRDRRVADWYAQYGVPVWLVEEYSPRVEYDLKRRSKNARAQFALYGSGMLDALETETRATRSERPPQRYNALACSTSAIWGLLDTQVAELEQIPDISGKVIPQRPKLDGKAWPVPRRGPITDDRSDDGEDEDARMYDDDGDWPVAEIEEIPVEVRRVRFPRPGRGNTAGDSTSVGPLGSSNAMAGPPRGILKRRDDEGDRQVETASSSAAPSTSAGSASVQQQGDREVERASSSAVPSSAAGRGSLKRKDDARDGRGGSASAASGQGQGQINRPRRSGKARRQAYNVIGKQLESPRPDDIGQDAMQRARKVAKTVAVSNDRPEAYASGQLPPWFPDVLREASMAQSRVVTSSASQMLRGADALFPIPKQVVQAPESLRVPKAAYFANSWSGNGQRERLPEAELERLDRTSSQNLFMLAQCWPYLKRRIEGTNLIEQDGLTPKQLRDFFKHKVTQEVDFVLEKMGMDVVLDTADDEDHETDDNVNVQVADSNLPAKTKQLAERDKFPRILEILGNSTTWQGQQLPAWDPDMRNWAPVEWRRFMIWSVAELQFRHELLAFDVLIRQCHGRRIDAYITQNAQTRYGMLTRCWGGGGVVPTHEENPLCSQDKKKRFRALVAFRDIMRAWPYSERYLPAWKIAEDADQKMPSQELLEQQVWTCYGQVYFDYRHREPPLPFVRPALPFEM